MCRAIKQCGGYVAIQMKNCLAYKFSVLSSFLASIMEFIVMIYIWTNVYQGQNTIEGFSFGDMITYLCMAQGITAIYGWSNAIEGFVAERIQKGDIVFDIVKPIPFNRARIAEGIGSSFIQVIFVGLLLFCIHLFVPNFSGPYSVYHFLLFLLSFVIGYMIMSFFSLLVGLLSFVLMSYWGLYYTKKAMVDLFSGALIPFVMLPPWFAKLCEFLPFSKIVYTPVMIYMGQISGQAIVEVMILQVLWCVVLYLAAKIFFRFLIRRVTVNGG